MARQMEVWAFLSCLFHLCQTFPPHSHTNNDECVYVLKGTFRCSVDNVTRDLCRGMPDRIQIISVMTHYGLIPALPSA